jgi:NADPH-dependent glutamate synthase beta subunit-like oxidoreductase/Pyruvate/2-oxoacid:ferredoxin oxidoreductase delta subunit
MPKLNPRQQVAAWQDIYPAPCQAACPVHTDARTYVTLIAEGRLEEAYLAAREPNPLAAVCGRACSAPCEEVCTRGEFDRPVRIRQLKRYLSDRFDAAPARRQRPAPTGRRVAVAGAGPAGLAAAHELARRGHNVTVFEAAEEAGGMATLGVPRFRLPMSAIRQDVATVESLGVTLRTGVRVGVDISLAQLREEHDAVFIATGATRLNELAVPGIGLHGVVQALPYLEEANLGGRPATGQRVAVIGGGYTAMDAARTALRLGAEAVTVLYRRTRSETEVHDEELNETLHEGVTIDYLVSPLQIRDDGAGGVSGLQCIRNRLGEQDASGRPRPVPIAGSDFIFEADMVILAIGQAPDPEELGFADKSLASQIDPETMMTPLAGVFAGGDFISGPSTIIEAVDDGRRAASSIHRFLGGVEDPSEQVWPLVVVPRDSSGLPNGSWPTNGDRRTNGTRTLTLEHEVEAPLSSREAVRESLRCLFCGLLPTIEFEDCTLCHLCAEVCPVQCISQVALDELGSARPAAGHRDAVSYSIEEEACIRCGRCFKVCPTGAIVIKF